MTGKTYIDSKDIWTTYGAYVTEGGYDGLAGFAPLKAVESNDWQEEDGIEADLSAPELDTRSLSISFAFVSSPVDGMIKALSDKGYHSFRFSDLGDREFKLRLVSAGSPEIAGNLRLMTLTFADDFPLEDYTYAAPSGGFWWDDGYTLDGVKLSDYGIRVLEGTRSEMEGVPDVKTAMLRNISVIPGAEYDGEGKVTFKSRDLTVRCLMRAGSMSEFWENHDALLYDLSRPQERTLYCRALSRSYMCYYRSISVEEFIPSARWMKFSLKLTTVAPPVDGVSCYATGVWIDEGVWRMADTFIYAPANDDNQ